MIIDNFYFFDNHDGINRTVKTNKSEFECAQKNGNYNFTTIIV